MLVFLEAALTYLAIPRTGSQAFEAAFAPLADIAVTSPPAAKHMTLRRFRRRVLPTLEDRCKGDMRTLAIVRDPVARLESWYRYRRRPTLRDPEKSTRNLDFATFVEKYLEPDPPLFARIGMQAAFVAVDGVAGVDHVFAFEHLHAAAGFLSHRLGARVDLPHLNASTTAPLHVPGELRLRLRSALAADIALHEAALSGRLHGPIG